MNPLRVIVLISLLTYALFAIPNPAFAETSWVDGIGDWFNGNNWSAGVPNSNITTKINNGGTAQISAAGAAASDLNLGVDVAHSGTVAVDGSGGLNIGGILDVGVNGTGILNITNGGAVSAPNYCWIAERAGSVGNVTVDGAASTLTVKNELKVGFFGTATLSITNGGTVSGERGGPNAPAVVGDYAGSEGTVTIDGTGSTWTSGFVQVGRAAPGTLSVANGGTVVSGGCIIAEAPGVQGSVMVDGISSSWVVSIELLIGDFGVANLQITNGGAVSSFYDGWIAFEPNSSGMVTVDGPNSIWSHQGTLVIGLYAPATLRISNGGAVSVCGDFACIGCDSDSQQSTVTVDGAGSYWTNTGHVFVAGGSLGPGGTAMLHIDNGATVTAANLTVYEPGTLTGNGFVDATGGTTLEGTLAPDQTISLTGNLAFGATATMLSTVTPTSIDSVFVEGTATLNGTLGVTLTGGPFPVGSQYILLQSNGLNGTTFSTVSISAPPDVNAQVTYDTNVVYLVIEPTEATPTLSPIRNAIPRVNPMPRLPHFIPAIAPCSPTPIPRPTPTPRPRPTPRSR
jgi:T5SS/PEP-CTERM-associated repeat protein